MIELGGNIKLEGFHNIEPALLIVVKKITGNYVKKICDKLGNDINELKLELTEESGQKKITGEIKANNKTETTESKNINLFFALDKVLNTLLNNIQ